MKNIKIIISLILAMLAFFALTACGEESTEQSEDTAPAIYIQTNAGAEIPLTKETVGCRVSLKSSNAQHCATDLGATIRCRGNGSLTVGERTGKLPYKLKFNQKINPFGLGDGKEKDWVLIANVGDQSMLRNYGAKLLGEKLEGIPYSPNVLLVHLYINGEYVGMYELTEQIEVKSSRVNVNDEYVGNENGFLVELDNYAKYEDGISFSVNNSYYTVKSNVANDVQLAYIQDYIARVDDAIYAGDRETLATLVDMDSLVDMFLLQEFAKNNDVGYSSFFMYREVDGKLYFAPPWDFDLAFGNDHRLDDGSHEGFYVGVGRGEKHKQNHKWYIALFSNEWFVQMAAERWREISDTVIPEVIDAVAQMGAQIAPDMERNYEKWEFFGERQQQEPDAIVALDSYGEHVDYLVDWMRARKAWLDDAFAE